MCQIFTVQKYRFGNIISTPREMCVHDHTSTLCSKPSPHEYQPELELEPDPPRPTLTTQH